MNVFYDMDYPMDTELTAWRALEIAETIERNGAKFYRHAAASCKDLRISSLFLKLAGWEDRHMEVFRQMKERYAGLRSPSDSGDAHAPAGAKHGDGFKTRSMAGLAVFGIQPDPAKELTGRASREDALRLAVEKEKDSIVFYSGLKNFLDDGTDEKVLDDIIAEEMKHIRILTQSLQG
jgi:rubrerythrin